MLALVVLDVLVVFNVQHVLLLVQIAIVHVIVLQVEEHVQHFLQVAVHHVLAVLVIALAVQINVLSVMQNAIQIISYLFICDNIILKIIN